MRFTTVGVGALASARYAPAGLLVAAEGARVMIDGGPGAEPTGRLTAWLVSDEHAELRAALRKLAGTHGLPARVASFRHGSLSIAPRPVVHTNHPAFGYVIRGARKEKVVWAPEFLEFPSWARDAALMFAEASSWDRPIRFVGGVGGHLDVLAVAAAAKRAGVHRLVFAHIGRPTIRALDAGLFPPFGEFACDGQVFVVR